MVLCETGTIELRVALKSKGSFADPPHSNIVITQEYDANKLVRLQLGRFDGAHRV